MTIGIFGGTFNPIHNGHIALAKRLLDEADLDEVWFVVSPQNPWKQNKTLLDDNLRLEMTRAALEGEQQMKVSDIEFSLPRPSYMWNTLQTLSRDFPEHEFVLLIGGDNWEEFDRWHCYEEILRHHRIVVYPRATTNTCEINANEKNTGETNANEIDTCETNTCETNAAALSTRPTDSFALPTDAKGVSIVNTPLLDISSTDIRRRISEGQPWEHLVPQGILNNTIITYMKKNILSIICFSIMTMTGIGCLTSCGSNTTSKGYALNDKGYPVSKKVDTIDVYFGDSIADPYRWLENDTTQETTEWVDAQNEVTADYLAEIPFRDSLRARLTTVSNYEKVGTPFKKHGKYYFYKNDGLQNQSVLYVKDSLNGEPRVFLDPNTLSEDGTVALSGLSFSKDGKYFGYSISRNGSDWQEIFVKEVESGRLLDDHLMWCKFTSISWHNDGFYYSRYDAPEEGKEYSNVNEGHKVYYHKLGTPQSDDQLTYSNPKYPQRFYSAATTDDEDILFLFESGGGVGTAVYAKDLKKAGSQWRTISATMDYEVTPVEVINGTIYLYSNYQAPKGKLVSVTLNNPSIEKAREIIPEAENVLSSVGAIGGRFFVTYSKDACDHIYQYSYDGKQLCEVALPGLGTARFSGNKDDKECFFSFTSFTVPGTTYNYDLDKNSYEIFYQPKVEFDTNAYTTEQIFFESKDGTRVPMFVTHKKDIVLDGNNPVLIYGYGGFNISLTPSFSSMRVPFLEKGGIYVSVNLRGGSEYGEEWHQAGTKMQKQNVFDDFISAAEYLIANKYTNPERIAITGGSNGGLLVGACMIQRPDLYKAVVAAVGVMDMLRYHKFTIGWNWASDYGTSEDNPEMFRYLKAYSPLHALTPETAYPACLITTADHDDRVVPAHSFKFAARLQECNAADTPSLIRIDKNAGHGGGKPMSKVIDEYTDEYAFMMYNIGMTW